MDLHLTLVRESAFSSSLRVASDGDAVTPQSIAVSSAGPAPAVDLLAERQDQIELSEAALAQFRAQQRTETSTTVVITIIAQNDEPGVDFASVGDPHLSIREHGVGPDTTALADSMVDHADLASVDAIAGGYRVATTVTALDAGGRAYNQSATVTLNDGTSSVMLDRTAGLTIVSGGAPIGIGAQSITLAGGAVVTLGDDRSVTIRSSATDGGDVETVLSLETDGNGVDVHGYVHGLTLSGDLADLAIASSASAAEAKTAPPA